MPFRYGDEWGLALFVYFLLHIHLFSSRCIYVSSAKLRVEWKEKVKYIGTVDVLSPDDVKLQKSAT